MTTSLTSADFAQGSLVVHDDPARLRRVTAALRAAGRLIALVPTMGALHEGHRRLLQDARALPNSVTVASIFVNPTQFGVDEDFETYPRDLDADLEICRQEGVSLVFAPPVSQIYPADWQVCVSPGPLGEILEGVSRPGHFIGVLSVVAKLINIVGPDFALFGEKDYQQLTLIRRMARDLNMRCEIIGVPTVRESDGLALSSRNQYLSERERSAATAISAALVAGAFAGERGPNEVISAARAVLLAQDGVDLDYLELRTPDLSAPASSGEARLLIAARIGTTRLIDNISVRLPQDR